MKTKILLPILYVVLVLVACKKDPPIPETTEPVMPPLTHQGLNTFGCYVDFPSAGASGEQGGELFVANDGESVWDIPALSGSFNEFTRELVMQGRRYINTETGERDDVIIRSLITDNIGVYNYTYNKEHGSQGYVNWKGMLCNYNYLEYADFDLGKITVTYLNETENIIAGTFYINLLNPSCEEDTIMKITDGRFDFNY
ncbi:MAG: hypothetical protein IT222_00590 [Crocinitomix sp.]|nr:hypothetical protein [Crocinitomix sp.]